jgi:hypothetical protein
MAKKVVGCPTEIYRAVVLELYRRITANSLQVSLAYGSPVLRARYYASHTITRGRIDMAAREPNPEGEEHPFPGLPLTNTAAALPACAICAYGSTGESACKPDQRPSRGCGHLSHVMPRENTHAQQLQLVRRAHQVR